VFVLLFLNAVVAKSVRLIWMSVALSLAAVFIFSSDSVQLALTSVGFLAVILACFKARSFTEASIKLNLSGAARSGALWLTLGLSLVIAGEYYSLIRLNPAERAMPKIQIGNVVKSVATPVLSRFVPTGNGRNENVSVDEFLLTIQSQGVGQMGLDQDQIGSMVEAQLGKNISPEQRVVINQEVSAQQSAIKNQAQQKVLDEGRKKLTEMSGREVRGDEKISDVMAEIVSLQIEGYFNSGMAGNQNSSTLTIILAFVVFLTVFSIGSFLDFFLVYLTHFIFFVLVSTGGIKTAKITKEVEVIE
jgi:hypothetical protein